MNVELEPEVERRLQAMARDRSQSISELIEEAMVSYLSAVEGEASAWVEATQRLVPQAWRAEDFSDWNPPDGR